MLEAVPDDSRVQSRDQTIVVNQYYCDAVKESKKKPAGAPLDSVNGSLAGDLSEVLGMWKSGELIVAEAL